MSIKTKILFVQTFRKSLIKNASQQTLEKFDQTASQSSFIQNDRMSDNQKTYISR